MTEKDCIFCKILRGELPSFKVYEDEFTYAFMDIAKDVDGHILVIPKKHCKNTLDCDGETLSHVISTVQKISQRLVENCGYDGVDIMNANNAEAGQTVFHLHYHIVPRKKDDGVPSFPKYTGGKHEVADMYKTIMEKL